MSRQNTRNVEQLVAELGIIIDAALLQYPGVIILCATAVSKWIKTSRKQKQIETLNFHLIFLNHFSNYFQTIFIEAASNYRQIILSQYRIEW